MSRLTSSLFHKPSPFDASPLIPSPPESHSDTITPYPPNPVNLQDLGLINHSFATPSPESAGTRLRKSSSIPYHGSSLRDSREKGQRSGKSLIIVIPPPTLVHGHGDIAHTLSNGPFHRLSEGVIMPLYPSMITQLAAIAREFNFPSTSGLCLYLHHVADGLTMKPRISDDSWPSIWSYLSDSLNEHRPLISGKVEFDIDLRLARWHASWLSSIHRELSDYHAHTFPSTGPSSTHFRGDSQFSLPEGRLSEVDVAEHSFIQTSEHNRRHVPRKLSLVERFDLVPLRPDVKSSSRSALSQPDVPSAGSQVLSTIVQEEEPKTSKDTLDSRVKSWRESALLIPNPLAATGQTSLDLAKFPSDTPINNELSPASAELKMEDFTWSISSAGPKSCDSPSSVSEVHVPSVHLASRVAGTVCSTPSVCTSFGPDSSECISPMSWSRAPSVHIASRLAGSVCTSPSICTSFGPEDNALISPFLDIYRVSTPDIAHRLYESVPSTPQTATTWGAPLSYPPSPRCPSPSPSLDLGERSMSIEFEMLPPSCSSYELSDTAVWPHVWPYINEYTTQRRLPAVVSNDTGAINSIFNYPYLSIYNPIYPYLEIYPAIPSAMAISSQSTPVPSSNSTLDINVGFQIPSVYPPFDIYPAVYPFNLQRIYPSIPVPMVIISQDAPDSIPHSPLENTVEFGIPWVYPSFCLYPAVYPFNLKEIYPATVTQSYPVELPEGYSYINIYPPLSPTLYAHLALYNYHSLSQYPEFRIYHDLPAFSPPIVQYVASEVDVSQSIHLRKYPIFNIYPAIYPFFDLYPAIGERKEAQVPGYGSNCEVSLSMTIEAVYPFFNLYPPTYPHLEIYLVHRATAYQPALEQDQMVDSRDRWTHGTSMETRYPSFNLYKAIYPHFDIYPTHYTGWSQENLEQDPIFTRGLSQLPRLEGCTYPFFNLYPAVYPHFDLYPAPGGAIALSQPAPKLFQSGCLLSNTVESLYPAFNLYPAVYPYFDLYLPSHGSEIQAPSANKRQARFSSKLTHSELHAMVMMEMIGPARLFGQTEGLKKFEDGHHVHGNTGSSSSSKIRQTWSLSKPLRDRFEGGTRGFLHNVEKQTEMPPSQKVENIWESGSSRSPGKRDSVVWQRIKAFDSSGCT